MHIKGNKNHFGLLAISQIYISQLAGLTNERIWRVFFACDLLGWIATLSIGCIVQPSPIWRIWGGQGRQCWESTKNMDTILDQIASRNIPKLRKSFSGWFNWYLKASMCNKPYRAITNAWGCSISQVVSQSKLSQRNT